MKPIDKINPIAKTLQDNLYRPRVVPNKKRKEESRKNKTWKKDVDNSFTYDKRR